MVNKDSYLVLYYTTKNVAYIFNENIENDSTITPAHTLEQFNFIPVIVVLYTPDQFTLHESGPTFPPLSYVYVYMYCFINPQKIGSIASKFGEKLSITWINYYYQMTNLKSTKRMTFGPRKCHPLVVH